MGWTKKARLILGLLFEARSSPKGLTGPVDLFVSNDSTNDFGLTLLSAYASVLGMLNELQTCCPSCSCFWCVCRYADLKINRTTNYTFNFDQMLNDKVHIIVVKCLSSYNRKTCRFYSHCWCPQTCPAPLSQKIFI